ncbi:MAG: hypothetical protein HRU46_05465, partial [Verrucomicrobiales bacterium]|nr:hypothetical protein [Verrucomicrobiales bacterium]
MGGGFPLYRSKDGTMELVISGPGKVSSAAAAGYLAGRNCDNGKLSGWINFGIAGSGSEDYGKVFLGNCISSVSGVENWYPPAVWPKKVDLERRRIITVEEPTKDYPNDGALVEMEAAGFYPTVLRMGTTELCQVMKVVSDDPGHAMEAVDKATVIGLCHDALDQANDWLAAFRGLVEEEAIKYTEPDAFQELLSELRFSVTQQHQLRRLLQQLVALGFEGKIVASSWKDGKSCLSELRKELENLRASVDG